MSNELNKTYFIITTLVFILYSFDSVILLLYSIFNTISSISGTTLGRVMTLNAYAVLISFFPLMYAMKKIYDRMNCNNGLAQFDLSLYFFSVIGAGEVDVIGAFGVIVAPQIAFGVISFLPIILMVWFEIFNSIIDNCEIK